MLAPLPPIATNSRVLLRAWSPGYSLPNLAPVLKSPALYVVLKGPAASDAYAFKGWWGEKSLPAGGEQD